MTATGAAPDPATAAQERWQRLLHRLDAVGAQLQAEMSGVTASLDTCLTQLDALRHRLAERSVVPPPAEAARRAVVA
ncbi:hypothetical protein ACIG5E_32885 [Kitasatospora sp. NPDC053057]|uniref:hypothetical protein n=1 Tax=Kitasatospora sp. NPDC053057 TaxID=3364062 RepID=UPI0037C7C417